MKDEENPKSIENDPIFICLDDDATTTNDKDLINSFKSSFKKPKEIPPTITISDDDEEDDNNSVNDNLPKKRRRSFYSDDDNPNPGPLARQFVCEMCNKSKPKYQFLEIKGCFHSYCCGCIEAYVSSKLDGGVTSITCPAPASASDCCFGSLDPEYCKDFLSKEIYQRWGKVLCESVIAAETRFYCPFKDCNVLLVDDWGGYLTMAECPYCRRLFCVKCRGVWHEGVTCEINQSNNSQRNCGGVSTHSGGAPHNVQSVSYPCSGGGAMHNVQSVSNPYSGGGAMHNVQPPSDMYNGGEDLHNVQSPSYNDGEALYGVEAQSASYPYNDREALYDVEAQSASYPYNGDGFDHNRRRMSRAYDDDSCESHSYRRRMPEAYHDDAYESNGYRGRASRAYYDDAYESNGYRGRASRAYYDAAYASHSNGPRMSRPYHGGASGSHHDRQTMFNADRGDGSPSYGGGSARRQTMLTPSYNNGS